MSISGFIAAFDLGTPAGRHDATILPLLATWHSEREAGRTLKFFSEKSGISVENTKASLSRLVEYGIAKRNVVDLPMVDGGKELLEACYALVEGNFRIHVAKDAK